MFTRSTRPYIIPDFSQFQDFDRKGATVPVTNPPQHLEGLKDGDVVDWEAGNTLSGTGRISIVDGVIHITKLS